MRCLLGLVLLGLAALGAHADWRLDRFMISTWGGPVDEASARAYADAGFNTVMAKAEHLDLCRRHGLQAIVMDGSPEMAAKFTADPAVWGWYVRDEPTEENFGPTGEAAGKFHEADPNHPAYINLMAWMNLGKYYELVKPRFLSYDYYQWWWGTPHYCWRLEAHRDVALKRDQDLVCWVEANADQRWEWGKPGATYLPDNAPKLRQSVYLALAYGVRGIQWFNSSLVFERGEASERTLTASGRDIKALNRELTALGPTLLRLKSTGVYHTDPLPPHTQAIPADLWVQARNRNLTLGLFKDEAGARFVMVVNRTIDRVQPVNLRFALEMGGICRLNPANGQWDSVGPRPAEGVTSAVRLLLAPGDGVLLRVR